MPHLRWLLLVLCALLLSTQVYAKAPVTQKDANEIFFRLPNGLTVYVIRDTRFPLVCTRLYVYTGSSNETPAQAGISHVLEHMVFKGTSLRPKGQVAAEVESLGGYVNAATSFDKTWYITDMPKEHWKVGLDVVKDMAFNAVLDENELRSEKDVIVSELERGEDQPDHKLFEMLQLASLHNSPYGHPIIGYEKTIRAVSRDDLIAYRNYWYQPQNMALLVAGDIDPKEVCTYIQTLFGSLQNTHTMPETALIDVSKKSDSTKVHVSKGPWKKVYLGLSFPAPAAKDLRSVDLDVLSYLLTGDATSYLYRTYKYEKQLVDGIGVSNMSLQRGGLLTLTVQMDADKVSQFFDELTKDLATLSAKAFSDEEIARAVFSMQDDLDKAGETLSGLASFKATVAFLLGGSIGEKNIRDRLATISRERLQQSLTTWFDPNRVKVRVLAPEKAALPDFEAILAKNWGKTQEKSAETKGYMQGVAERIALENGCSLLLIPDTSAPYLSISLSRAGGNALLAKNEQGLATLTAALLTDGCGSFSAQEMEAYLTKRAISMKVSAERQAFSVQMHGPSRFEKDIYDILLLALTNPRFEEKELSREIATMKASLQQREDRPMSYLFSKIYPLLYPNHPYGYDELGTQSLLESFTRDRVVQFWKKQEAQPWVMSVVGSFSKEAVLSCAQKLAKTHKEAPLTITVPQFGKEKKEDLHLTNRRQAHLVTVFPAVAITHEDAPALLVLANVLSGQSGLLFSSMRDEEGLGYTVTAFMRSLPKSGAFYFYIGTVPEKMNKAQEGFKNVIEKLCAKPRPHSEITAATNRLLGDYLRSIQSLQARSNEASYNALLGLAPDFRMQLIEKAKKVTPEQLQKIAQKYLMNINPYTVTLMP